MLSECCEKSLKANSWPYATSSGFGLSDFFALERVVLFSWSVELATLLVSKALALDLQKHFATDCASCYGRLLDAIKS